MLPQHLQKELDTVYTTSLQNGHPPDRVKRGGGGGGGGGGGAMTTFGDLGNYVNDFTPSPHDF